MLQSNQTKYLNTTKAKKRHIKKINKKNSAEVQSIPNVERAK